MKQGFGYERSVAPVKTGDELTVTIEGVGEKGDGIAKIKGFVLFVPNTKQGDHVVVRVNRVLAKVGFAEVVRPADAAEEKQQPSEEEQQPAEEQSVESSESYEDTEDFGEEE